MAAAVEVAEGGRYPSWLPRVVGVMEAPPTGASGALGVVRELLVEACEGDVEPGI